MKTKNTTTLHLGKSIGRQPLRLALLLIPLAFACFALTPASQAVLPPPAPDGGYLNNNTAEGTFALFSLTTGGDNTAIGANALTSNTKGGENTATGADALSSNTDGGANTANGVQALQDNTTGDNNTADGVGALFHNTRGNNNTANGVDALSSNTTISGVSGTNNTATGVDALFSNTTGGRNTASGTFALFSNATGGSNTANGFDALFSNTGSNNIGLGNNAGVNLTTGSNNIDIGNAGVAGDDSKIRIGKVGTQTATFVAGISGVNEGGTISVVTINGNGQLGTQAAVVSSRRFKKEIKPMDKASEAILGLKPVTFQYKSDNAGTPQFGLIAEEVEKVNPDLVVRDEKGEIYTVRYEAVNAMLLNEFLKEHRKVEQQEATITQLKDGMELLTATVKEQASQIQKVSAQLEVSKPAPQMVGNNQ